MLDYQDSSRSFYSHEAERAVIAAILLRDDAVKHVFELSVDDFTLEEHKAIFSAMQIMAAKREVIDLVTLHNQLTAMGYPSLYATALECASGVITLVYTEQYIAILKDRTARRRVKEIAQKAFDLISDPVTDTAAVIEESRKALRDIMQSGHSWVEMPELLLKAYSHFERVQKGEYQPIRTGIDGLNKLIDGFFPGELTVIGARPGVGKSALALDIAYAAASAGKHVAFVSIEMSEQQFAQRIYSKGSGVNGKKLRTGDLEGPDWILLCETLSRFSGLPMSYLFTANTIEDIQMEVQRKVDAGKIDLLIVDYMQIVRTRQKFRDERLRVAHVSAELKQMTKDYGIPVIALSQLRRAEAGRNSVPGMQDLRESGNIEADADGIILLHRPEDVNDPGIDKRDMGAFDMFTKDGRQYVTLNVEKQRQGSTGRVATIFNPAIMSYTSIKRG